ncbi:protoporphyrinogen oxidase [Rossellomorea marisflavi]|uniref:protoporphyrinogen oxidase n=1 Tax=Rossellomorea marisflavi TaxID=189381 RepID=UPI00203B5BEF|nr:protoporphyrinogen oxidase [Rossellomorea marisflavi]MCM2589052.1 protoporphyrinogen oxidase [Rossellomorea marisflavi]
MKTVAVVGGGITGLTTLYYLQEYLKGEDVRLILIEGEDMLGGKIQSISSDPFIMEVGADSIVSRHPGVLELVGELGLMDELVYNETGTSFIYTQDTLHKIPTDSVFGIPMTRTSLMESTLISDAGKRAALLDYETENDTFTKEDSIGDFLEFFLGKELVQNQIAPVLSGVYSGDLHTLSMSSTLPYLLDYKNAYGSIMKGLWINREKHQGKSNKKFVSFKTGLSAIINRLDECTPNAEKYKGIGLESLKKSGRMYSLELTNGETISADATVLAIPHNRARGVLNHPELNEGFSLLKTKSLKSIYLGFDLPDTVLPADGTGFIVAKEQGGVKSDACTWTSRKWKHTSVDSQLLVRLFYKDSNPHWAEIKHLTQEELLHTALRDIEATMGLKGVQPIRKEVTDWSGLMPNYNLEHAQSVRQLESSLAVEFPGVMLAGASYYGVGIGACIQNGKKTAEQLSSRLR